VKGIFVSHEYFGWRVLGENRVRSIDGTNERITLGRLLVFSEVSICTNFEKSVRKDHVIKSSQQTGCIIC